MLRVDPHLLLRHQATQDLAVLRHEDQTPRPAEVHDLPQGQPAGCLLLDQRNHLPDLVEQRHPHNLQQEIRRGRGTQALPDPQTHRQHPQHLLHREVTHQQDLHPLEAGTAV